MGRKKATTPDANPDSNQEVMDTQESSRQMRKRVAKVTPKTEVESDDEPVVKKGRGRPKKKEDSESAGTTAAKKGRASKKVIANGSADVSIKDEPADAVDGTVDTQNSATVEEQEPSTSRAASSGKGKKNKKAKEEEEEAPPTKKPGVERTVVMKGAAPVDALCPIAKTSHVYEEGSDIWDCMLNQTNIQFNNNKYYLIQLLKDDSKDSYSVWMRWGRVGANGQNSLQACGGDLEKAKKIFMKKFSDKTKNDWDERDSFEKVPGKYDLLAMDYTSGDTTDSASLEAKEKVKEERKKIECRLEIRVRGLIELICDVRIMEETVVEMKYDAKKAPLGKLTADQIKAGYMALKNIDDLIIKGKYSNMDLVHACNAFYTRIPHYFGMKVPPLIKTKAEVQEKVALLEALGDIQAALSVLDQPIDVNVHPVDQHYSGLKCDIAVLEKDNMDYKTLEKYIQSTHAKTHCSYKMEVVDIFQVKKEMEYERFKDVGNRMLLFHGSRLSNWAGILSQGLRIAPPEAPVTGYMFGKGIYFADMSSKSANYCWATQRNNVGFVALSEVSLGKTNDLLDADYNANKLPKGCNSVKGLGRTAPQPENFSALSDGTVVPMGPGVQVKPNSTKNYSLLYNEYIVYDPAQVRTRFLVKIKFLFR